MRRAAVHLYLQPQNLMISQPRPIHVTYDNLCMRTNGSGPHFVVLIGAYFIKHGLKTQVSWGWEPARIQATDLMRLHANYGCDISPTPVSSTKIRKQISPIQPEQTNIRKTLIAPGNLPLLPTPIRTGPGEHGRPSRRSEYAESYR